MGRAHRSPSRNSQQSTISSLSTVSTPAGTGNRTPTNGDQSDITPTQSRQASIRSRHSRRGSGASGAGTPTPRNSGHGDTLVSSNMTGATNGSVVSIVNGDTDTSVSEAKHKVNGNSEHMKSKLSADGSNNNDIDSIPCV